MFFFFFFSSRRRHTRLQGDWSSDVCSSDLRNQALDFCIGAMLRSEDGYAKIESLVPGGPAQTDGRVKVGDRITAVAQGPARSEERRVGKECRSRWSPYH